MKNILPMDELNRLDNALKEQFGDNQLPKSKEISDTLEDYLFELFEMAYAMGNEITGESLGFDFTPSKEEMTRIIDAEIAGKTWRERVEDYFSNGGTVEDISRIASTETHRIANEAAYKAAKAAGATSKTWHCLMLPTSRDSHVYLDGITVPIDGEFHSFKGHKTLYPGQWGVAEEDVNCLCFLTFDR